jgi:hypothetical protein
MQIMDAVSLSSDDFDPIIGPVQDSGTNRVLAMVHDPIKIAIQHLAKSGGCSWFKGSG